MLTPLRGRIVVREHKLSPILEIIHNPRDIVTHRGTVIAVGAPFRLDSGAEIPLHFKPGDVVQFHFDGNEKARTVTWDGEPGILVMAQREIDAVIEP
jgi:co-chaperonin GroES (HSP10)